MLPDVDGLALVEQLREVDHHQLILVMSAYGSLETAIEAIRRDDEEGALALFRSAVAAKRTAKRLIDRNVWWVYADSGIAGKDANDATSDDYTDNPAMWGPGRRVQLGLQMTIDHASAEL